MFTADDKNGFSYFLNINTGPLAVVCPDIQPPAINDSCYVDITEEVKRLNESFDVNCNEEKYNCPNCGPRLVKKLTPPKNTRNK